MATLAGVARADGAEPKLVTPPPRPAAAEPVKLSHLHQFEVSLRLALGLRAIAPYDDGVYCGTADSSTASGNAPVCTGRAPFSLDFELGYGAARKIDTFLELRLGLESDFGVTATTSDAGPRMFHLSPGARFFFSEGAKAKLFTTAQVVLDLSGYKDLAGDGRGADFGLRNLTGLWFDLDKAYGFYGFFGETLTFARWLRFELEAGVGFQGRYR